MRFSSCLFSSNCLTSFDYLRKFFVLKRIIRTAPELKIIIFIYLFLKYFFCNLKRNAKHYSYQNNTGRCFLEDTLNQSLNLTFAGLRIIVFFIKIKSRWIRTTILHQSKTSHAIRKEQEQLPKGECFTKQICGLLLLILKG